MSCACLVCVPLRIVPCLEPRSRTIKLPSIRSISQCNRLTQRSFRQIVALSHRPRVMGSFSKTNSVGKSSRLCGTSFAIIARGLAGVMARREPTEVGPEAGRPGGTSPLRRLEDWINPGATSSRAAKLSLCPRDVNPKVVLRGYFARLRAETDCQMAREHGSLARIILACRRGSLAGQALMLHNQGPFAGEVAEWSKARVC